jgi:hypothetical protein
MERNAAAAAAKDWVENALNGESDDDASSSFQGIVGGGLGGAREDVVASDGAPTATTFKVTVNAADFEPGLQALEATGLRGEAADMHRVVLRDAQAYIGFAERMRGEDFVTQQAVRRSFGRFVTLLDRYGREGARTVTFYLIRSDNPEWRFDEADQARLFGEVLPKLPFLEKVHFCHASLPIAHLKTFASRLSATSSLVELDIDNSYGDFLACVPDLAAMIRRSDVPLQVLKLNARMGMDRDACRQIFDSLQHNTTLRTLEVRVEEAYDDGALTLPTNKASSLRHLLIDVETWTREGKSSVAWQLKTNTLLENLQVVHRNTIHLTHCPWVEMLESHNFTLRSLREQPRSRYGVRAAHMGDVIPRYLRRNGRIQQALDGLRGYHVAPAVLWPRVLGMVSGLPALLYRFVRLGDLNALVDLLVATHGSNKRSRPPPPPRRSHRVARLRSDC